MNYRLTAMVSRYTAVNPADRPSLARDSETILSFGPVLFTKVINAPAQRVVHRQSRGLQKNCVTSAGCGLAADVDVRLGAIEDLLIVQPAKQFFAVALVTLDHADRFHMGRVFFGQGPARLAKFTPPRTQCFFNQFHVFDAQIKRTVITRHPNPLFEKRAFPIGNICRIYALSRRMQGISGYAKGPPPKIKSLHLFRGTPDRQLEHTLRLRRHMPVIRKGFATKHGAENTDCAHPYDMHTPALTPPAERGTSTPTYNPQPGVS